MEHCLLTSDNFQDTLKICLGSLKKPGTFLLLPTETVYGLVCSWKDTAARGNIYKTKQREGNRPFQMLASNVDMVKAFGGIISPTAEKIVRFFCPGPITIVVPAENGQTIGFRIPDSDFIMKLIKLYKFPLAGTSANLSGEPPTINSKQALFKLKLMPDVVVDSGTMPVNSLPSTVIKVSGSQLEVLREGPISLTEIQKLVQNL